jgi:hypothetical protein
MLKDILLLPLLFNFTSECAIRKDQKNQNGLECNKTHQNLIYIDVKFTRQNKYHTEKHGTLLNASTEVGLKIKAKKTK